MKFLLFFLPAIAFSQMTLVVYKQEKMMEVWINQKLVQEYPICRMSGTLGPKRCEGDLQVPEGIYKVIGFNPHSMFTLSFQINYPNASDRVLGGKNLGGEIFFHGKCVSAGCVSFTDEQIKEIYPLVRKYKRVDVLIFPARYFDTLYIEKYQKHWIFWQNLEKIRDFWVENRRIPRTKLDNGFFIIS